MALDGSIRNAIDPGSFIAEYMEFMSEQETPTDYDLFCALWCLSVAVSRRTYVARPRAPVYLNMFTLLVAESGVTRKSTAVRVAKEVLRHFIQNTRHKYLLIENKTSPEQLEYLLQLQTVEHGYANAIICISELVTFLGRERYTMQMPGLLTDLYDSPSIRVGGGTITRGAIAIKDVYVNFLSASTPSWLVRSINPDVIEGGFTSRCLFVVQEEPKRRIAWPSGNDRQSVEKLAVGLGQLHERLCTRSTTDIHITLDDEALAYFTRWYEDRRLSHDPFRASFESREDGHILRVAALLALNNGSIVIRRREVTAAIKLIEDCKEKAASIFAYTKDSKLVDNINKLRTILVDAGVEGIKQSKLSLKMRETMKNDHMIAALEIMHELDMVQRFELETKAAGRKPTIWRATKLIAGPDAPQLILERWEVET